MVGVLLSAERGNGTRSDRGTRAFPDTTQQATPAPAAAIVVTGPVRTPILAERAMLWLLAAILAIAASYRWFGPGKDYLDYYVFYSTVTPYATSGFSRFEVGFELSAWFCANVLRLPFELFYFVIAFPSLVLKLELFSRYTSKPIIAISALVLIWYPLHEYTQIRVALAIALGYWGVIFLVQKLLWRSLLLFALAFTFHSSIAFLAVVALGLRFMPSRLYLPVSVITVIGATVLYQQLTDLISGVFTTYNPLVDNYLSNTANAVNTNLLSGSNIINFLSLVLMAITGAWRGQFSRVCYFLALGSIVSLLLFRSSPVLALRISDMMVFALLLVAFRDRPVTWMIPVQGLMVINGLWTTYRAIGEGVFGA